MYSVRCVCVCVCVCGYKWCLSRSFYILTQLTENLYNIFPTGVCDTLCTRCAVCVSVGSVYVYDCMCVCTRTGGVLHPDTKCSKLLKIFSGSVWLWCSMMNYSRGVPLLVSISVSETVTEISRRISNICIESFNWCSIIKKIKVTVTTTNTLVQYHNSKWKLKTIETTKYFINYCENDVSYL